MAQKVKKYRKPLNLNIGMLIFGVVFVYVVIYVVMYFQKSHYAGYEVKEGSLSTNNIYRGIVLREETVVNADTAGYINNYAREGSRVAKGDLVYMVDETGSLNEYFENISLGENTLSKGEMAEFRNEIVTFMHNFDGEKYASTYDFKYALKGTVMKLANSNLMENISDINGNAEFSDLVDFCGAPETGIVSYWVDGFEELTPDMVTEEVFDEKTYEKTQLLSTELAAVGAPVYKLSTDEEWSVVFPIEEVRGAELEQEEYVKVKFLKNQYESWGKVKLLHNADGKAYLQLTFTNSMITFTSDRFLEIELILNDEVGLKIPNSSIVEREFFLVPEAFVTKGGNKGKEGVIRQCYLEDGTISSEFVDTGVYNYDEETKEYYLDTDVLNIGDILLEPDSQNTYTVSKRATLIGVYNMNKGYADFSQIKILYQNEEYAIVESNTKYGLNVYDYIILNADTVTDNQFIY